MGYIFSKIWKRPPIKIIMVGLQGAGKTSIIFKLKLGEVICTIPAPGMLIESVEYKGISFNMWDLVEDVEIQ